jgi:hypothetical protein
MATRAIENGTIAVEQKNWTLASNLKERLKELEMYKPELYSGTWKYLFVQEFHVWSKNQLLRYWKYKNARDEHWMLFRTVMMVTFNLKRHMADGVLMVKLESTENDDFLGLELDMRAVERFTVGDLIKLAGCELKRMYPHWSPNSRMTVVENMGGYGDSRDDEYEHSYGREHSPPQREMSPLEVLYKSERQQLPKRQRVA